MLREDSLRQLLHSFRQTGLGGGHHSFEDHHTPMLAKYGAIRREKNIVLVCGSGFGDAKVRKTPF